MEAPRPIVLNRYICWPVIHPLRGARFPRDQSEMQVGLTRGKPSLSLAAATDPATTLMTLF